MRQEYEAESKGRSRALREWDRAGYTHRASRFRRGLACSLAILMLPAIPGCQRSLDPPAEDAQVTSGKPDASATLAGNALPTVDQAAPGQVAPDQAAPDPAATPQQPSPVVKPPKGSASPAFVPAQADPQIVGNRFVDELPIGLELFETVFWDARDSTHLRTMIQQTPLVRGKTVLEIGTGSGLIALCCIQAGARHAVATDINPAAVVNATHNAKLLGFADRFEARQVSQDAADAFAVIRSSERFDLILSNPPWELGIAKSIDEFALYDDQFALLRSLLAGLADHLTPGGKAYLVYGHADAIRAAERLAEEYDLSTRRMDDRDLDQLPRIFLPGMVIEVEPENPASPSAGSP